MSLALRGLHPAVRGRAEIALSWAHFFRIPVQVTSGFRSWEDQAKLRARFEGCVVAGRFPSPGECQFPANRPGDSAHNFGFAWDSTVPRIYQPAWNFIREIVGFNVPSNDLIHAEVHDWRRFVTRVKPGPIEG